MGKAKLNTTKAELKQDGNNLHLRGCPLLSS